ncbi:MAG: glycosyltransferase family 2 protein, partial [Candidatus Binataceae bacterium]
MKSVFFFGSLWLVYVYAGYPLLLVLVAIWRRVYPTSSEQCVPSVSVLMAARNEEKDIGWKITETIDWDYPSDKLDILVASDGSDDSTDEVVRSFADPRVVLVRMEQRGGKARALNRMAKQARNEILFFTDANSHIGQGALRLMVRHFADPRVGCVTGNTRFIDEGESAAVSVGGGTYLGYETTLKRLENRIGSVLVCDGAIFCIRSALFEPLDPNLANDLELPMRVGAAGYWVLHEPAALVLERGTSSPLEEFQRLRRMCAQGTLAMFNLRGLFFGLRGWQFISHKFLRWTSLIPMLLVLLSSAVLARNSAFFASLLALQVIFYALAAFGLERSNSNRPVAQMIAVPFYVVFGVVGALVGVIDCLRGKRFDVWEVPSLSRGPVG